MNLRTDTVALKQIRMFGFDSKTNDYEVLIAGVGKDDSWMEPYLFSLTENCWKRVTAIPLNYAFDPNEISLPFVNGAVHWNNWEVLLHVANGKMVSLDFNSQQMELQGVEVATGPISLEVSYVESLVLLDKAFMSTATISIN
ncbi:hypothetical protein V6N11_079276 [Hibiscus sabdariffa]|uniref:Uncharacterized protein n=1 Tax=Hibiscus sabdariffa TaxID=183260 RepID=A0ABR2RUX3_9ROSI